MRRQGAMRRQGMSSQCVVSAVPKLRVPCVYIYNIYIYIDGLKLRMSRFFSKIFYPEDRT